MNDGPPPLPPGEHRYYQHAGKIKLARRISARARRRLYQLFLETMRPTPETRILDVGTTDDSGIESNMLEQLHPHRDRITCLGLTDGKAILAAYPGVRHVRISVGQPFPFPENAFDIVHCNAVLEHVGPAAQQAAFLREICRVAPRRFVAVPNRAFPVEHHTGIPFIHYLPKEWFRRLLRGTRYDVWSHEQNLNYISSRDLRSLWPGAAPTLTCCGVGWGLWKSNLVAYQA